MRSPGVTITWLTSSARDQIPVPISTVVTGLTCDVGQTRACTSVRVTEASSPTRGTLSGIHARRVAGASWITEPLLEVNSVITLAFNKP